MIEKQNIIKFAKAVIESEIDALKSLKDKAINKNFLKMMDLILNSKGKIILSGVGKSGLVAQKIASTLVSTGTQSLFIHPVEALHGELGIIFKEDIAILFSNSGDTSETNKFAAIIKKKGVKIIAITNNENSKISSISDITINLKTPGEACPHNIVPTSSTTAMMVFGDVIAITLMKMKGYGKKDFALNHPGGNIGRLLYVKVSDIMRKGKANPVISADKKIKDAISAMTKTSVGAVSVVDSKKRLVGFFTDGDIRRNFNNIKLQDSIKKHMTRDPISINQNEMAILAANIMHSKKIDNIPVVDDSKKVVGIIDERDLIKEGII
ncbi:MAG: KpsF/GutQ family sugar-phosphate isomerase [Elusimicrobiota bacterium]